MRADEKEFSKSARGWNEIGMRLQSHRPRHSLGLFRDVAIFQREISPHPQSLPKHLSLHSLPFNGELTNTTQTGFAGDCGDNFFATFGCPADNFVAEMTITIVGPGGGLAFT
jgi:hypothetical protein